MYHRPKGEECETSVEHGLPLWAGPAVGYCSLRPRPSPMWGSRFVGARAVGPWVGEQKPLGKTPLQGNPSPEKTDLPTLPRGRRDLSPDVAKIPGRCHECQTTKARRGKQPDTCEFAPVPQYPFTSLTTDFCKLPECLQKSTGKKVHYLIVMVCHQTGYVLAIRCQEKGLDSKSAASLFLDRCVHMFGLPKEVICDNVSIINSEFLKDLFAMTGVEQHSSVAYRPQSNGRAERAVQSIVNSLKQYLEHRGGFQKAVLGGKLGIGPLGFEQFAGGSQLVFPTSTSFSGRDPVGWGDCLPVSLQYGAEDAGQCFGRMFDERAEVRKRLQDLHAKEFAKFLAKHPEQWFKPGDRVWVRNRIVEPPVHGKLERVWQGPCEVLRHLPCKSPRKGRDLHFSAIEDLCPLQGQQESAFALLYG